MVRGTANPSAIQPRPSLQREAPAQAPQASAQGALPLHAPAEAVGALEDWGCPWLGKAPRGASARSHRPGPPAPPALTPAPTLRPGVGKLLSPALPGAGAWRLGVCAFGWAPLPAPRARSARGRGWGGARLPGSALRGSWEGAWGRRPHSGAGICHPGCGGAGGSLRGRQAQTPEPQPKSRRTEEGSSQFSRLPGLAPPPPPVLPPARQLTATRLPPGTALSALRIRVHVYP